MTDPHEEPNVVTDQLPANREAIVRIDAQLKGIDITMTDESMPLDTRRLLARQEARLILSHLDEADEEVRTSALERLAAYGLTDPEPPR